ncbi:E3 ubiquitin-protein ligase MARCHF3-like [Bacillus rossius redtenbacheri]|uniref:E3 ubiquitin-protein ligase MARCHF3-like n=1 Tax=Bacillus rossius redtenbacheri TaxID=93214 RepID=UPI002FDDFBB2
MPPLLELKSADACMYCGLEGGEDPPRKMCHCPSKAHRACLQLELMGSQTDSCELCGFEFAVQRTPRSGLARAARHWLGNHAGGGQLMLFVLWALVVTPAAVLSGYFVRQSVVYYHQALAIRRINQFWWHAVREPSLANRLMIASLLVLLCYGACLAALLAYNTWRFLAWRRRTSHVSVVDPPAPAPPVDPCACVCP